MAPKTKKQAVQSHQQKHGYEFGGPYVELAGGVEGNLVTIADHFLTDSARLPSASVSQFSSTSSLSLVTTSLAAQRLRFSGPNLSTSKP